MRITHSIRTAKSAKAKAAMTLFSALAALGVTAAVLMGATAKPRFDITVSPATQTVTAGGSVSYGITAKRDNKFTSPIALSVTGLPTNATGNFSPNPVPGSGTTASLSVQTDASTPAGSYPLTIRGTSGSLFVTRTVTLVVLAPEAPNFTITTTPALRVLSEEDDVSYTLAIARSGGFTGPVALSQSELPKNVTGTYSANPVAGNDATLTLTSSINPKPGTYTLTLTGTGFHGGSELQRSASIQLVVEEKKPFGIAGEPSEQLVPGVAVPLDLALTNPHSFPLQVTEVAGSVATQTSQPGCDGAQNYSVDQMADVYPLTLPPQSTSTLTQLGVSTDDMPAVRMNDLVSTNQDACKGASVFLSYSGTATK